MRIAGIGSRETPPDALHALTYAGAALASQGHRGSSGGARGADQAFEAGFRSVNPSLLRSYTVADATPEAHELAARYHPAWDRCSDYAKMLHARNGPIVLSETLCNPVDAILCWTPGGRVTGGTGQALRIAADVGIPVFNLAVEPLDNLWQWMHACHQSLAR